MKEIQTSLLEELRCSTLPLTGAIADSNGMVDVCWGSLPMGCSWSFALVQAANEAEEAEERVKEAEERAVAE